MPESFDRARFLKVLALTESDMDSSALATTARQTPWLVRAGWSEVTGESEP
jgi:hypothetical protein